MVQLGWWSLEIQPIISIVLIVFVFIGATDAVDHINCINRANPGVLNCNALQLKDNANDPTNSGMNFWGKKGERL